MEEASLALSSDRRLRRVRFGVRIAFAELSALARLGFLALAVLAFAGAVTVAVKAAPSPSPAVHPHVIATWPVPKVAEHAEIIVQTNGKGQVVSAKIDKPSPDKVFNTQVYGNALQAFIRTPDGNSVTGLFRLTYDYDPKTAKVKREVSFIKAGGDPNAIGAVPQMLETAKKGQQHAEEQERAAAASAQAAAAQRAAAAAAHSSPLPDLNHILGSPGPAHT